MPAPRHVLDQPADETFLLVLIDNECRNPCVTEFLDRLDPSFAAYQVVGLGAVVAIMPADGHRALQSDCGNVSDDGLMLGPVARARVQDADAFDRQIHDRNGCLRVHG
jgi:hypothetical protein